MGNSVACFYRIPKKTSPKDLHSSPSFAKSKSKSKRTSSSPPVLDDEYIKQQAQIASKLYLQHLNNINNDDNINLFHQLERSSTTRNTLSSSSSSKTQNKFSTRSRSLSASLQVSARNNINVGESESEKKHFVLVHGGGFGAWCWYKMVALLKEKGDGEVEVDAIDLTGSGSNFCDINSITSLPQYAKPLTHFLANLQPDNKKVILVGHDLGGAVVSYAMEMYPNKVSKAIYVAATMLANDQSALGIFSQQQSCINNQAHKFIYANGNNQPPTCIDFEKSLLEDLYFNRTPSKDIALASLSMRTVPFAPLTHKLTLSPTKYGSISRFYITTHQDSAIPLPLQQSMIQAHPPQQVFHLKAADHSPFFSRPHALHTLLLLISNIPPAPTSGFNL